MGFFRAHHKKKGKVERSQLAVAKAFNYRVKGKPELEMSPDLVSLLSNWDKGRCCDTDSCNDGKGHCNGSCQK